MIKGTIIETALEYVPYKMPINGGVWLTEKTLQIAEKRHEAKAKGEIDKARQLHADFQREARIDKNNALNAHCISLEEAFKKGRTQELFATVKQVKTPFSARQSTIKDRDGNELTDQQDIKERWQKYTEDLYTSIDDQQNEDQIDQGLQEPDLLESKVEWAMRQLPSNKVLGIDGIPAKLLRPILRVTLTTFQQIWKSCTWPADWRQSVFIPIPKKGDTRDCANYQTIALIPHASKILLKVIQKRLGNVIDRELPDV